MKGKTILVAEDVPSNYLLVATLLQKEDYAILHAVNGREAIDLVRYHAVDLILMDIKMPLMNGLTAIGEIRKFNANVPIIVLTVSAVSSDRDTAFACGCNDYMLKPFNTSELMKTIARYL